MADAISIKKYRLLSAELWKRTQTDRLDWSASIMSDGFDAGIGSSTINLAEISTGNTFDYRVTIYSDSLAVSDVFTDVDIASNSTVNVEGFDSYYSLLRDLYILVKRKVEGADAVLDQVLKDLGVDS